MGCNYTHPPTTKWRGLALISKALCCICIITINHQRDVPVRGGREVGKAFGKYHYYEGCQCAVDHWC